MKNIKVFLKKVSDFSQNNIIVFTIISTLEFCIYGIIGYVFFFLITESGTINTIHKGLIWKFIAWILIIGMVRAIQEWNSKKNKK